MFVGTTGGGSPGLFEGDAADLGTLTGLDLPFRAIAGRDVVSARVASRGRYRVRTRRVDRACGPSDDPRFAPLLPLLRRRQVRLERGLVILGKVEPRVGIDLGDDRVDLQPTAQPA